MTSNIANGDVIIGRRMCQLSSGMLYRYEFPLASSFLSTPLSMSFNNSNSSNNSKPSAVSSVVNDLIRAAVGGDARNVGDEDLDKYVADMILKEAEAKSKKYQSVGVSAYMPE